MKKSLSRLTLLGFVWLSGMAWSGFANAWQQCIAIDGDTLYCEGQKIRLTNVYAAEMNEADGAAAKHRMEALVASGHVTLLRHGHDKYGRVLAEVFVNGRRIEQADIGPKAGRGTHVQGDRVPVMVPRSQLPYTVKAKKRGRRATTHHRRSETNTDTRTRASHSHRGSSHHRSHR